ncbi:FecR family protein [Pedobacter gandavensis]|uniref:FecR family protein n=1 Tax=Pedobacter gandavensis TaxID=2679963 RepID=UPI00292E8FF3|nr:FecR domain-containing protein [Pedobacter gandavensis]
MKKQISAYETYTLAELINDQDFLLWVLHPDEKSDLHWQSIENTYPKLQRSISEARAIVQSMRFEKDVLAKKEQDELWNTIQSKTTLLKTPVRKLWYRYAVAAVLAGALLGIGILYQVNQPIAINTPYGQLKTITLPDGSLVTLNANSTIKYDKDWSKNEIREVWIEGEAFLKVKHLHTSGKIAERERFVVHTGDVNVEVLGTSFNVNDRRGRTEVALLEGKISLGLNGATAKPLILAPGDIAEFEHGKLIKKPINVAEYASWKDGRLYFKDVPLAKIFNDIEDIYGYKVVVDNPEILKKTISGSLSTQNEQVLFKALGMTLNLNITPNQDTKELMITTK